MEEKPPTSTRDEPGATDAQRARLLDEVRALAGATLQKIYLLAPHLAALQLRVPGRTLVVAVDARSALAALMPARPEQPAGTEGAPRAQATLRNALAGASLAGARLQRPVDAPDESRQRPFLRLDFATPQGPRALVAEPRAGVLALLAPPAAAKGAAERIVWMSAAAGELRTGAPWPALREVVVAPAAEAAPTEGVAARALRQDSAAAFESRRRALEKQLRARAQKLARTLQAVEADAARARGAEEQRRNAQLLLPEQGRVQRGAREALVPDWSQLDAEGKPALVPLQLDPALSAAQNAARWLKRAQRYAAAAGRIDARRAEMARAVAEANALVARAAQAQGEEALRELAAALGSARTQEPRRARAGAKAERVPYRAFRSESGARILVGRSARDNDALTFRLARGNDLWLHARGVQGSHVIVPDPGAAPDERALIDAALLAAHFSSARNEPQVEVAWTRRKHVHKPRGAPAGAVTYAQERVLRVRMVEERLAALLARENE